MFVDIIKPVSMTLHLLESFWRNRYSICMPFTTSSLQIYVCRLQQILYIRHLPQATNICHLQLVLYIRMSLTPSSIPTSLLENSIHTSFTASYIRTCLSLIACCIISVTCRKFYTHTIYSQFHTYAAYS